MKPKNFILLFIFGLFLFLLPNAVEALCYIDCVRYYEPGSGDMCNNLSGCWWGYYVIDDCGALEADERLGIVGTISKRTSGSIISVASCSDGSSKCQRRVFPTGTNGQSCTAIDQCWHDIRGCIEDFKTSGVWDASESKCVVCNGNLENVILGYSSTGKCADGDTNYGVCAHCGNKVGDSGNGKCESACGAAAACDEKAVGASCGTGGTCDSSCQCIVPCQCTSTTIGGCCDGCNYCPAGKVFNGTSCVDSTQTVYCGVSCTGGAGSGCTFKALECKAGGVCDDTNTYYTTQNIPSSKVCTGNAIGESTYEHFCQADGTNGSCTFTARECGGAGTCTGGSGGNTVNVPAGKVYIGGNDCTSNCYGDSTATIYCGVSCTGGADSGCTFKALECKAGGVCDDTNTYYTTQNIPADKVCTGNALGPPSTTNYCAYAEDCDAGDCSASKYYRSCGGAGSCRANNTGAHTVAVTASAGYTLTSTCGTTGTTYCLTNQCRDGGGWHHKCGKRCDAAQACTYWIDASCVDHCTNGFQDCDETGVDTGGSCPVTCTCTAWSNVGCGVSPCLSTQMKQTRTCTPAGCNVESQCVDDPTCVTPGFNFSILVNPTSGSVAQNSQVSTNVQITRTQGTSENVTFWTSNLPSGITSTFSPTSCTPSDTCNSTLTLLAASNAQLVTNWLINVGGTATGGFSNWTTYSLTVTAAGVGINPPSVTTNPATNIAMTSATLNGTLNSLGYDPATCPSCSCIVWFKWGPTTSTEYSTPVQTITSAGPFSANISGLTSNTTYYFEAFAKNGGSW